MGQHVIQSPPRHLGRPAEPFRADRYSYSERQRRQARAPFIRFRLWWAQASFIQRVTRVFLLAILALIVGAAVFMTLIICAANIGWIS